MLVAETRTATARRSNRPEGCQPLAVALAVALPLLLAVGAAAGPAVWSPRPAAAAQATIPASPAAEVGSPTAERAEPRTLGELADRVDVAWAGVTSFRAVFVVGAPGPTAPPLAGSPVASPVSAEPAFAFRREVVLPGRQRLEQRDGGVLVSEAVVADGRVAVRGVAARALLPEADPATWVAVDLAALPPFAGGDPLLARIVAPIESPLARLPDNLRPQDPRPLGEVEVAGRTCRAYGAADTTRTGARIDITIAVDGDDLPCFVETRSGGAGGRETFDAYGASFAIEPPAQTVPASPAAAPATPDGRD